MRLTAWMALGATICGVLSVEGAPGADDMPTPAPTGAKITHAVIAARVKNTGGNPGLAAEELGGAVVDAIAQRAKRDHATLTIARIPPGMTQAGEIARSVPGATHAVVIDADFISRSYSSGGGRACTGYDYEGRCVSSEAQAPERVPSRVKFKLQVTDLATGRAVFRYSREVGGNDATIESAAGSLAYESLRVLKQVGLL